MGMADGHAAQSVAESAARRNNPVIVIVNRARVIKIPVAPYPLVKQ